MYYSSILTQFIAINFVSCSYFQIKCRFSGSVIAWKCSFKLVGLLADLTVHFETRTNRLVRLFIRLNSSILTVEAWLYGLWPPVAHISCTKIQFFIIFSKRGNFFQIKVIYSRKSFQKVDAKASSKWLSFCRCAAQMANENSTSLTQLSTLVDVTFNFDWCVVTKHFLFSSWWNILCGMSLRIIYTWNLVPKKNDEKLNFCVFSLRHRGSRLPKNLPPVLKWKNVVQWTIVPNNLIVSQNEG